MSTSKSVIWLGLSALTLSACAPAQTQQAQTQQEQGQPGAQSGRLDVAQPARGVTAGNLKLGSASFTGGGRLANAQAGPGSCGGQNVSPALSWSGAPEGTVSYTLTAYDPDAPTGSGFWHWLVYNLPAGTTSLAAGAGSAGGKLPEGAAQGPNDSGTPGYTGACPPVGDAPHRYVFTLYALNKTLDLPAGAGAAFIGFNLNGATLAKTSITASYSR